MRHQNVSFIRRCVLMIIRKENFPTAIEQFRKRPKYKKTDPLNRWFCLMPRRDYTLISRYSAQVLCRRSHVIITLNFDNKFNRLRRPTWFMVKGN